MLLPEKKLPVLFSSDFRVMDAVNGTSGEKLFSADAAAKVFSQERKGNVSEDKNSYNHSQSGSMAALAYDPMNNNLVYMPMFSSNIYILNAKTKEITLVENTVTKVTSCDINSHITRMTAGYDGNIYALIMQEHSFCRSVEKAVSMW